MGIDAVSRGREVPVTRGIWDTCGRVGRDRCPVKKAGCVSALHFSVTRLSATGFSPARLSASSLFAPSYSALSLFVSGLSAACLSAQPFCASCVFVVTVALDMDPSQSPSDLLEMDHRNPTTSHDCTPPRGLAADDHLQRLEPRPALSTELDPPAMLHPSEVFPESTENGNAFPSPSSYTPSPAPYRSFGEVPSVFDSSPVLEASASLPTAEPRAIDTSSLAPPNSVRNVRLSQRPPPRRLVTVA